MSSLRCRVGDRVVYVTVHATERYQERVRPALDLAQVRDELRAVLTHAVIGPPPDWYSPAAGRPASSEVVMLGDAIIMPLVGDTALTCTTTSSLGDVAREAKQRDRQGRRRKSEPRAKGKPHAKLRRQLGHERRRSRDNDYGER